MWYAQQNNPQLMFSIEYTPNYLGWLETTPNGWLLALGWFINAMRILHFPGKMQSVELIFKPLAS